MIEKAISMGIDLKAIEMKTNWSDIGQHKALDILFKKNSKKNILQGDVVEQNAENTTVMSSGRQISLLGVRDLIIIDTKDSLLVVNKNSPASMRDLIKKISKNNKEILHEHSVVHRPWGSFMSIEEGNTWQIKKIYVEPGASLSLQMHFRRSEHWVVVSGTAKIEIGNLTKNILPNESVYIPLGVKHRLSNPTELPLTLIEIQSGNYLGEDDIKRFRSFSGNS